MGIVGGVDTVEPASEQRSCYRRFFWAQKLDFCLMLCYGRGVISIIRYNYKYGYYEYFD